MVLLAISSNVSRAGKHDVVLPEADSGFATTGLKVSSSFRCSKLFTAERGSLVQRRLGQLTAKWLGKMLAVVQSLFVPSS